MNPITQPSPQTSGPQMAQPSQATTIDVVSAPAQSIPVRQVTNTNPFSMAPAQSQPAAPIAQSTASTPAAASPHPAPATTAPARPKRSFKHLWPAGAAILAAVVLATAAVYAFRTVNEPANNPTDQTQAAVVKPITSADLDQLSKSFGDLSNLNDAQDFSADSLSNQAFGF